MTVTVATVDFKEAMARVPSGVSIVTTSDETGRWWGFTATSFCSVSMEPPLMLVCLANTAECHPAFTSIDRWNIHLIQPDHADLAVRFATRGADKFGGDQFTGDAHGLPHLTEASMTLHCQHHAQHDGGDHTILMGQVDNVELNDVPPAIYYQRTFHQVSPEANP